MKKRNLLILAVALTAGVNEGLAYLDVIPADIFPKYVKGGLLAVALGLKIILPLIKDKKDEQQ